LGRGCDLGSLVGFLSGEEAGALTHDELEARLATCGRDLLRQLFHDHLGLRASRERRAGALIDAAGVAHEAVEAGHHRGLATIVGAVTVTRLAYRAKGAENLHLQDASLNLRAERHSHGLRALAAIEAARGSYEEAQAATARSSGVGLGKSQVEDLARRAAIDVEVVYDSAPVPRAASDVFVRADDNNKAPAPVATGKWLTASAVGSAKEVIAAAFDEAQRRELGHARPRVALVAGAIAHKATALGLDGPRRNKADECTRYLKNKRPYLDYPKALTEGRPIATGVIERACRHPVRDRSDITGARWSFDGAEAMLKLRAVRANGDWDEYWRHHLAAERDPVRASRYAGGVIPAAA